MTERGEELGHPQMPVIRARESGSEMRGRKATVQAEREDT